MKYSIAGMDIGTEEIKICIIEIDTKDNTEHVVGFFKYRTEGLHRGYIMNEKTFKGSIGRIMGDLAKILGSRIDTVAVAVGTSHIDSAILGQQAIITKADNEVTHFDIENLEKSLEESITEKTKKLLYSSIVETNIDGKIVASRPEGMRGIKLDMKKLFIQIATKDFEQFEDAFFDNDIEMVMVYPKGIPASQVSLTEKQKMVGVGYLDIGAETIRAR
jgi:cell division protein FtsA